MLMDSIISIYDNAKGHSINHRQNDLCNTLTSQEEIPHTQKANEGRKHKQLLHELYENIFCLTRSNVQAERENYIKRS